LIFGFLEMERVQSFAASLGVDPFSPEFAIQMDSNDELQSFRSEFIFPHSIHADQPIYLCGNSLGLQPKNLRGEVVRELDKWAEQAVEGHFTGTSGISFLFFINLCFDIDDQEKING
jgi:hypothetical protein